MLIKQADIIFSRKDGNLISSGIRFFDGGLWSHTEVVAEEFEFPTTSVISTVSAEAGGVFVMARDLSIYSSYAILRNVAIINGDQGLIVNEACKFVGAGNYDYQGLFGKAFGLDIEDSEKYVCSEVVHLAYRNAGYPLIKRLDYGELVTPKQLWNSAVLEIITFGGDL